MAWEASHVAWRLPTSLNRLPLSPHPPYCGHWLFSSLNVTCSSPAQIHPTPYPHPPNTPCPCSPQDPAYSILPRPASGSLFPFWSLVSKSFPSSVNGWPPLLLFVLFTSTIVCVCVSPQCFWLWNYQVHWYTWSSLVIPTSTICSKSKSLYITHRTHGKTSHKYIL